MSNYNTEIIRCRAPRPPKVMLLDVSRMNEEKDSNTLELHEQLKNLNQQFVIATIEEYKKINIEYSAELPITRGYVFILYQRTIDCNEVIGYVNFELDLEFAEHVIINQLYVDEKYRRKGVAKELLSRAIAYSAAVFDTDRFVIGFISSNVAARSLYHSMGFNTSPTFEFIIKQL